MADQIVGRSRQFLAGEAADIDERIVDVGDHPLGIGGGDQPLFSRKRPFSLGNRLVVTHEVQSARLWIRIGQPLVLLNVYLIYLIWGNEWLQILSKETPVFASFVVNIADFLRFCDAVVRS
jgi:hypothetical protein